MSQAWGIVRGHTIKNVLTGISRNNFSSDFLKISVEKFPLFISQYLERCINSIQNSCKEKAMNIVKSLFISHVFKYFLWNYIFNATNINHFNRLYFLEQFWVHRKIEKKVQRFPICPLPLCMHSSLLTKCPHQSGTLCYSW